MNLVQQLRRLRFLSDRRRLELFPPFWLMRIRVVELAPDWGFARIKLPLTAISRNLGGSMFGGYQASLADPIAALACARRFPQYSVWTRALKLDFRHEGRTDLELRFTFDIVLAERIDSELQTKGRSTPTFHFGFYATDGTLCTHVENTVAIRQKGYKKPRKEEL
jgi:acyl-coenzyme A thioesterase PaaI-like protein